MDGLRALASKAGTAEREIPYKEWALWLENLLEYLGFFECILQADEEDAGQTIERVLLALGRSEGAYRSVPGRLPDLSQGMAELDLNYSSSRRGEPRIATCHPDTATIRSARGAGSGVSLAGTGQKDPFLPSSAPILLLMRVCRSELGLEPRLGQEQSGLF